MTITTNCRQLQHLGTPLRPRQGRWIQGSGDLASTWFCYDPHGRVGIVYARPYHDRRGCVRWRMWRQVPPTTLPGADEIRAAHEVVKRLERVAPERRRAS